VRLNAKDFINLEQKSITLLGMSGVGKTFLSNILRNSDWFHYSGDYRIGTRYLDEPILDNIKTQAMQVPFLRKLLRSDSIYINNNITVDHLDAVSTFIGKIGDPELDGLSLEEFKRRQNLHLNAEIAAMNDVPEFIEKARNIYGFNNFINDAGGSLSELGDTKLLDMLAKHTIFIYIQANEDDEKRLIARSKSSPKPMYYQPEFLDEQLAIYMEENALEYVAMINPDELFVGSFRDYSMHVFHAMKPLLNNMVTRLKLRIYTP